MFIYLAENKVYKYSPLCEYYYTCKSTTHRIGAGVPRDSFFGPRHIFFHTKNSQIMTSTFADDTAILSR